MREGRRVSVAVEVRARIRVREGRRFCVVVEGFGCVRDEGVCVRTRLP